MGDDVGLGEFAGGTEFREFVPEAEVDVDLLVLRAIEGAGGGLGGSAAGVRLIAEEDEFGVAVGDALVGEDFGPCALGIVEYEGDKLGGAVLGGGGGSGRCGASCNGSAASQVTADVVASGDQTDDDENDDADDAESAAAHASAGGASPVFYVVAESAGCPVHGALLGLMLKYR